MGKLIDLTGRRFGRLIVRSIDAVIRKPSGTSVITWNCDCDCGRRAKVTGNNLRTKNTISCGCFRSEVTRALNITHGMTGTPEHRTWWSMHQRCLNPNHEMYRLYGGRGITVCERWATFDAFFADMGPKPFARATIERVRNDEGYGPGNCVWASQAQQNVNRRNNVRLTWSGETLVVSQWAERMNVPKPTIYSRVAKGWPTEEVLFGRRPG